MTLFNCFVMGRIEDDLGDAENELFMAQGARLRLQLCEQLLRFGALGWAVGAIEFGKAREVSRIGDLTSALIFYFCRLRLRRTILEACSEFAIERCVVHR